MGFLNLFGIGKPKHEKEEKAEIDLDSQDKILFRLQKQEDSLIHSLTSTRSMKRSIGLILQMHEEKSISKKQTILLKLSKTVTAMSSDIYLHDIPEIRRIIDNLSNNYSKQKEIIKNINKDEKELPKL